MRRSAGYFVAVVEADTVHLAAVVGTAHLVVEMGTGHSAVAMGIVLADPSKPSVLV